MLYPLKRKGSLEEAGSRFRSSLVQRGFVAPSGHLYQNGLPPSAFWILIEDV